MNAKRIHIPTARNRGEMISKLNAKGNKVWHGFKDPNVVYIGRGWGPGGYSLKQSPFHNPFEIDTDNKKKDGTRKQVVAKFRSYLLDGGVADYKRKVHDGRHLLARLGGLEGKTLACFCGPDKECHGDVLMEVIEATSVTRRIYPDHHDHPNDLYYHRRAEWARKVNESLQEGGLTGRIKLEAPKHPKPPRWWNNWWSYPDPPKGFVHSLETRDWRKYAPRPGTRKPASRSATSSGTR